MNTTEDRRINEMVITIVMIVNTVPLQPSC